MVDPEEFTRRQTELTAEFAKYVLENPDIDAAALIITSRFTVSASIERGWLGSSAASPQNATTWGLAARSSQLDPSHPSLAFRKVMIKAVRRKRVTSILPKTPRKSAATR